MINYFIIFFEMIIDENLELKMINNFIVNNFNLIEIIM